MGRMTTKSKTAQLARVELTFLKSISIRVRMWCCVWSGPASLALSFSVLFSMNLPSFQEDGPGGFSSFILSLLSRDIPFACLPSTTVRSCSHHAELHSLAVFSQCWDLDTGSQTLLRQIIFVSLFGPSYHPRVPSLEQSQFPLKLSQEVL